MPHEKQKEIFDDCDHHREAEVLNMLAQGRWSAENERHVRLWLDRKREARDSASSSAQMKLTRSAKNAAWALQ